MKVTIDTAKLTTDEIGELLRSLVFNQKIMNHSQYKEVGCYSTFEVQKWFDEIEPQKYPNVFSLFDVYDGYFDYVQVHAYESKDIVAMWYWDGDGDLLIWVKGEDVAYENTDCKHKYGWREVEIQPIADRYNTRKLSEGEQ